MCLPIEITQLHPFTDRGCFRVRKHFRFYYMIAVITFGTDESEVVLSEDALNIRLNIPLLGGPSEMKLSESPTFVGNSKDHFHLLKNENTLVGAACVEMNKIPEVSSAQVYSELLHSLEGYHLLRIWNYVPEINKVGPELENYKSFCMGRSDQFVEQNLSMPSASAVGILGNKLVVYFIATREPVRHWENPDQVPAYQYPSAYGPKSPSFSRASDVDRLDQTFFYISGTASIKGHQSVHIGDLAQQLETTLDNVRIMKEQVLGPLDSHDTSRLLEDTTIYLRDSSQLEALMDALKTSGESLKNLRILESDICRADLLVEIETQRPLL